MTEPAVQNDPFSPEEAPGVSLIVLMRIYDMLCGIYTHLDHDRATALMEIHSKGGLVGPLPALKLDELFGSPEGQSTA